MTKSMTGFGRGEAVFQSLTVNAEIKSVNHRYCEITVKLPRKYSFAEESIKAVIKKYASRGKIEISINTIDEGFDEGSIHLNIEAAKAYANALTTLNNEVLDGNGSITLSMLSSNPDIIKTVTQEEDEESILAVICQAAENACRNFEEMRSVEGKKLMDDILSRNDFIVNTVSEIEVYAPEVKNNYYEKLKLRIADLLDGNVEIPVDRIMVEAAVYADKIDITEEITRLKSHCSQMKSIFANSNEPIGKKLDFLVQEMNRESNTIGSKCNDVSITQKVLALKNEIEKIREQIQNIE